MMDYEKLGLFYLGKRYDTERGEIVEEPTLYDSSDLTTPAVMVGMTGSGKTSLGISLIEEAAIDRIPVIAVEPKGDLGNLLLSFPQNPSANKSRRWNNNWHRRSRAWMLSLTPNKRIWMRFGFDPSPPISTSTSSHWAGRPTCAKSRAGTLPPGDLLYYGRRGGC
jgi:hypothetical protein